MPSQTRSRLPVIVGALVVVVAVAVGAFLYLTRDQSDPPLKLSDAPTITADGDTGSSAGTAIDPASLDGSWTVVAGRGDEATVAGYRVKEVFAAGSREATANGRTNDVTGSLTVAGGTVTDGSFSVDMTTLASDEARRDGAIKGRGLQTDEFPEGTFELTEPITLPALKDGATFTVEATGNLTLHGVTKPVTIDLTGRASADAFAIQGSAPIEMADFDIEPPSIGGFVTVEDTGSFEFIVNFQKG